MMRKTVGLVLFVGCASPSLDHTSQQAADPDPQFSIANVSFESATGGSSIHYCPSTTDLYCAALPTPPAVQVRWGTPAPGALFPSGLGFDKAGDQAIPYNTPFSLGTITHFNSPTVAGTSAMGASLRLGISITPSLGGLPIAEGDVVIPFSIDDTSNFEDLTVDPPITCPYPSTTPCSDKIVFLTTQFALGSQTSTTVYDFLITGFVKQGTTVATDSLISDEGGNTAAELIGLLREHCVTDTDDDGICDEDDNCPADANADQADDDDDGVGNACEPTDPCPCDADWNNHGEYVSCVAHETRDRVQAGTLTAQARAALVSAAAQSSCGKQH